MRERALLIGGELTIESRPGAGTTVRLPSPACPVDGPNGAIDSAIGRLEGADR